MKSFVTRCEKDESGATAIEYGLIASLVSIAIVNALMLMRPQLEALFVKIKDAVVAANI